MAWTEIGSIQSSTSKNTKYAISVNAEGDLGCKCMSYAHSKEVPKVCKHVQDPKAGEFLRAWQRKQIPAQPVVLKVQEKVWYDGEWLHCIRSEYTKLAEAIITAALEDYRAGYAQSHELRSALRKAKLIA